MAKNLDTLLGQCFLRAAAEIAEAEGLDLSARKGQKLKAMKLAGRAMPKAMRVAEFIVQWAITLDDTENEELTLTEWRRWWNQSHRTAWRHLAEFRELFEEFDLPTPIAEQLVRQMRRRKVNVAAAVNLPVTV